MVQIDRYNFRLDTINNEVRNLRHWGQDVGDNWPVVYILNNNEEAYVGETVNAATRFEQHMQNPDRQNLTTIQIVTDKDYNKSVILDLESFLIKHMGADGKYLLQNGNTGLSDHEYYRRSEYEERFYTVWDELRKRGLVKSSIPEIENSALFKYSPYKSLGKEQIEVENAILESLIQLEPTGKKATIVVNGGAGTGKTILAIYLLKQIVDDFDNTLPGYEEERYEEEASYTNYLCDEAFRNINKVGIVFPQKSLRMSIKEVFGSIRGLSPNMVMTPAEVVKNYNRTGEKFDLLLVDEAHRLKYREKGTITGYQAYAKTNKLLGLDEKKGNELDWILKCSRNRIFFKDDYQTVRPCDISKRVFDTTIQSEENSVVVHKTLKSQWRCEGGDKYIRYMRDILFCNDPGYVKIDDYDLRMYDDCGQMISDIKKKNSDLGLCRVVAGFAWPWDRKDMSKYTIKIEGHSYRWNTTDENWIGRAGSVNEIGCIHTVQGYDLNYAGIIIGKDLQYDPVEKRMFSNKANYHDAKGKATLADDPEVLCDYIRNIYLTLLTRGIKGTYVYVCDEALREYFKCYLPLYK